MAVGMLGEKPKRCQHFFFEFFNLITDYPERGLPPRRNEDRFRPARAGFLGAMRLRIAVTHWCCPKIDARRRTHSESVRAKCNVDTVVPYPQRTAEHGPLVTTTGAVRTSPSLRLNRFECPLGKLYT